MEYRKTIIFLMVAIFIFSITAVSASDMNDTAIDNDNTNQIELSTDDNIIEYKTVSIAEDTQLTQSNNDEKISAGNELNEGTYSDLRNEIGKGGDIKLTKNYYRYVSGDGEGIKIITPGVIDGKGAVIDMTGINMHTFCVNTNGVEFKNLTIKNTDFIAGFGGAIMFTSSYSGTVTNCNFINHIGNAGARGGAVYFDHSGTVINCNFINNRAAYGGAVYFGHSGAVINCNFINNTAKLEGGAVYFSSTGEVTNCNFTNNTATTGGAIRTASCNVTNCNFIDNSASGMGGAGYFMDNVGVTNCNFTNNTADSGGAILFANPGNVTNCNFINNTAKSEVVQFTSQVLVK